MNIGKYNRFLKKAVYLRIIILSLKRGIYRPGVFRPRQLQQPLDQRAHLLRHGVDAGKEGLLLLL